MNLQAEFGDERATNESAVNQLEIETSERMRHGQELTEQKVNSSYFNPLKSFCLLI